MCRSEATRLSGLMSRDRAEMDALLASTVLGHAATGRRLIRLPCYEGLAEAKALYEWDYRKQLLRLQSRDGQESGWEGIEGDLFSEDFLLTRPLLAAIRATDPVVLLIDEVDRLDIETEV